MAYLLQLACIALLAEALLRMVPVASAGFRYAYWRLVLAGALVAPWLLRAAPSPTPLTLDVASSGAAAVALPLPPGVADALTGSASGWLPLVPAILAAGALVRVLVGSSRVDLQACKLEYSIVSPK